MCAVSNVGDSFGRAIPQQWPWVNPQLPQGQIVATAVSRGEFEALKVRVTEMEAALRAARAQDIADGVPDCQHGEKVALIKRLCEEFKIDISDVFETPEG